MTDIGYRVLCLFKGSSNIELSTVQVVESVFSSEFSLIKDVLENDFSSKDSVKKAKSELASLHRKVLYYLSKYEKEGTLRVTRVEGKGKKFFSINLSEGGIVEVSGKKIIIEKPSIPALPLGNLEELGFISRVEGKHFFDRVNAVLLFNHDYENLTEFYEFIYNLFSDVNDVIGISNFESLIEKFGVSKLIDSLQSLHEEVSNYGKRICCLVDFNNISDVASIFSFFDEFIPLKLDCINFLFEVKGRNFLDYEELIEKLVELYSRNTLKLNFKNSDLNVGTYIFGKSGPYYLKESVEELSKGKGSGIVITQTSVLLDTKKLIKSKSAKSLRDDVLTCVKALHYANSYQRKHMIGTLSKLTGSRRTFAKSNNVIRFWNYEVFEDDVDNLLFLDTLKSIKKEVDEFSRVEEIIYLSCGMPTNFKVSFSVAYRNAKGRALSEDYKNINISNINNFYDADVKKRLEFFEKAFLTFDGGAEVRFFRSSNVTSRDAVRELNFILNSFKLPLFCYNFSGRVGVNMNLDSFMN